MLLTRARVFVILAVLLAFSAWQWGGWLLPERALERRWTQLCDALADRDWTEFEARLASDYQDAWGHDRAAVVELARLATQDAVLLSLRREQAHTTFVRSGRRATSTALVRVSGQGGPLTHALTAGSQQIDTPTTFEWRRDSWRPWAWQLTALSNPAADRDIARLQRELGRSR